MTNTNNLIEIEELKSIQLGILNEVANFCEKHELTYFLAYGTLLGAIRHHGYIPWDDDIDIVMPRPDYERFVSSFNKADSNWQVIDHCQNPDYLLPFAKVHDLRTILYETRYKGGGVFGVNIDVFPLDGFGNMKQIKKIKRLSQYLNAKKAVIDRQRSLKKNAIIAIGKLFLLGTTPSQIVDKMEIVAKKNPYENSKKVKSFFSVYGEKEVCEKSLLEETTFATFEGRKYRVPKNYDSYLRMIYGDYMQLPPKEEQVTHHTFKAWWK